MDEQTSGQALGGRHADDPGAAADARGGGPARPGPAPQGGGPARPDDLPWPNRAAEWQRVSPSYAWADLAMNLLFVIGVAVVVALVVFFADKKPPVFVLVILGAIGLLLLVNAVLAFRRVRAIGYVLRQDDLLFRRGIMFERVIAVPYGRLQLVDVTRGPLLRALGLSTLKFVTASAATGVNLPGLPEAEAEALRDRLVELAETRRSGL